jgi:hypothetical protein
MNMKKLIPVMLLSMGLFACTSNTQPSDAGQSHAELATEESQEGQGEEAEEQMPDPDATGAFGASINKEGAIAAKDLVAKLNGHDSIRVKVSGNINACCQAKGCWMTMPLAGDDEMMVKFKDYGFFVPKNAAGKNAIIDGWAYRETVSVDELRHYAEDAGSSKAEIEKITKPEDRITFMADGVLIEPSAEGAH